MNPSRYNIYINTANKKSFIYNTLTTSLLLTDNSVQMCLQNNTLELLDPAVLASLQSCGIVTDSDELARYRFNHNTAKYNATMSSFLIFTTYACNLACPYCYEAIPKREYSSSSMSRKTTAEVIRFIGNQTVKTKSRAVGVALYGGEPLLNMECCTELLHTVSVWCKSKKISFSATLMSNGTLLDEHVYAAIGKYMSYIHITLDGPQHVHDKTRSKKDGSGSYWQILRNLKQLINTKEYLHIRINIDEESMHAVDEVLEDLENIGLKGRPRFYIYFSQIIPQKYCFTISNPEWDETKVSNYLPVIKMAKKEGWGAHLRGDPDQKLASAEPVSCGYVKYGTYTIDPGGDIYVCPALTQNPHYRTGTISDHPIWYPLYYDILTRDPAGNALCSTCEFLPLCKGGCPVLGEEDSTQCSFRTQLYERLKAYLESRFKKEVVANPFTSQIGKIGKVDTF